MTMNKPMITIFFFIRVLFSSINNIYKILDFDARKKFKKELDFFQNFKY